MWGLFGFGCVLGEGCFGLVLVLCFVFSPFGLNIRELLDKKAFRLSHLGVLCQSILVR